jgi:hypothetical protein
MTEPTKKNEPQNEGKKPLTLSEDDIKTDRRAGGGAVGQVGRGTVGTAKVIDPNNRGPGAPTDPDA